MRRLLCHRETGQELVEHAFVLPVLLLIFLGIVEFGVVVFKYNTVANAAREGARAGIIQVDPVTRIKLTDADVESIVMERGLALNLSVDDVVVDLEIDTVRVEITHTVTLMTGPIIEVMGGNANVQLHTVATMNRE